MENYCISQSKLILLQVDSGQITSSAKLYIGNLDPRVTEYEFKEVHNTLVLIIYYCSGTISSIYLNRTAQ